MKPVTPAGFLKCNNARQKFNSIFYLAFILFNKTSSVKKFQYGLKPFYLKVFVLLKFNTFENLCLKLVQCSNIC